MKNAYTFFGLLVFFGLFFLANPFVAYCQNVGIGTTNPLEKLHVVGNVRADNLAGTGVRPLFVDALGTITATGSGVPNPGVWWGTTGNSSTISATHFLGTTDNQSLNIRTNNFRRAWIDGNGRMVIGASDASQAYSLRVNGAGASNVENLDVTTINGIMAQTGTAAGISIFGQKTEWGSTAAILGANTKTGAVPENQNAVGVHGQTFGQYNDYTSIVAGVFGEAVGNSGPGGSTYGVFGQAGYQYGVGVGGKSFGLNGKGVFGQTTGNFAHGVFGQNYLGTDGFGVYGQAFEGVRGRGVVGQAWGGNDGIGVNGQSNVGTSGTGGINGTGVLGEALNTGSGTTWGVRGTALSGGGIGVEGTANGTNGQGIKGTGGYWGVYGTTGNNSGVAVEGYHSSNTGGVGVKGTSGGVGVQGFGNTIGVQGQAYAANSFGVNGIANVAGGRGVFGQSTNATGFGVFGFASAANAGAGVGVYGESASRNGFGVRGVSTNTNTTAGNFPIGVLGQAASPLGDGGNFQNSSTTGGRGLFAFGFTGIRALSNNATNGIAIIGIGNNGSGAVIPASGAGGAFTGTNAGSYSAATSARAGVTIGAYGQSASYSGRGLHGVASYNGDTTGSGPIGVLGQSASRIGYGGYFFNLSNNISSTALEGYTSGGVGIRGTAEAISGMGIIGNANGASGIGVNGNANNDNGTGIYGNATGTNGVGVYGTGALVGVRGEALAAGSVGLFGLQTGGSLALLTFGASQLNGPLSINGATNITGLLAVTGNFTASGTKAFTIDHPLDPSNKLLRHFSIESDEIINLYRGKITLNQNGEARVTLPDYFTAINKNFTYNLTCIGSNEPIFIKQEIENGSFVIAGGKPNLKVCWTVMAERNDLIMQKEPEQKAVVVLKGDKAGSYVSPKLYKSDKNYWANTKAVDESIRLPKKQVQSSSNVSQPPINVSTISNRLDTSIQPTDTVPSDK